MRDRILLGTVLFVLLVGCIAVLVRGLWRGRRTIVTRGPRRLTDDQRQQIRLTMRRPGPSGHLARRRAPIDRRPS